MKNGLIILCSLIILSCNSQEKKGVQRISQTDFQKVYQKGSLQLLDVRTAEEIAQGTIEGAVFADIYQDNFLEKVSEKLNKNKPVYVYCKAGGRSLRAAKLMVKKGFATVYSVDDGYDGWKKK